MYLSGLLWPIHLKPRPDELLSSWLMRLTRAYVTTPHTFVHKLWPDIAVWNRDPDRLAPMAIVEDLARHTGVSIQRAFNTTLRAYEGVVFEHLVVNGLTPWILPLRIWHRLHLRCGQQYCPACLAQDEQYFRRRWRLSLVTGCTEHELVLLDCCPRCGAPVNFHRAAYWIPRLSSCYRCGEDLVASVDAAEHLDSQELQAQRHLQYVITRGFAELRGVGPVYGHLYLLGYRAVCRYLLSKRGQPALFAITRGHSLPAVETVQVAHNNMDFAPISLRRRLILAAWKILADWPDGFVESCRRYRIRGSDILGDDASLPHWLHRTMRQHIDHMRYTPTVAELCSAIRFLDSRGVKVSPRSAYHVLGRTAPKDGTVFLQALGMTRESGPGQA